MMAKSAYLKVHFLSSVLLLHLIIRAKTEYIGFGTCPTVTPTTAITQASLNGLWYEQKRYDSLFAKTLSCISYTFSVAGATLDINGVHALTGRSYELNGRLTPNPSTSVNNYLISYNTFSFFPQQFQVIGYSLLIRYLVLYSCTTLGPLYIMQTVILTRDQAPNRVVIGLAENDILSNALPIKILKQVTQDIC